MTRGACAAAILLLLAASVAWADDAGDKAPTQKPENVLGSRTLSTLEKTPQYVQLAALLARKQRELEDTKGKETPGGRVLRPLLFEITELQDLRMRVRASAASASVKTGAEGRRNVVFSDDGKKSVLESIAPPRAPGEFNDVAAIATRFIIESLVEDPGYKALEPQLFPSEALVEREWRSFRSGSRARRLLVTELAGLRSLFQITPSSSSDRPKLLRRLAEGNAELESAAIRDKEAIERQIVIMHLVYAKHSAPPYEPEEEQALQTELREVDSTLRDARRDTMRFYALLGTEDSHWCESADAADPSSCGDEAAYATAFECESGKDFESAVKSYNKVIEEWPRSRFFDKAHLALGEIYFAEAESDPSRWEAAASAYRKAADRPAPGNTVWGYAHYRLASIASETGDTKKAISELRLAIDFAEKHPASPHAKALENAARSDLAALTGKQ